MKTYIYPQNLKATSRLWLWSIRDFLMICLGLILSVVILTQIWTFLPFAITAVFGAVYFILTCWLMKNKLNLE